ncbi:uncharacterized protein Z518_00306 [Rhinocladiella mackenziei CBS 650.93]|uniref:Rhinocladiella mackenziei CBS 650.93 unplaced genomic scaffold supercont1.1, whole genome shotgun sequence n=1 Tax=Rhinocladiella mackenziei CBS 650.93 TaxID=1442369 RepID=A0A0D2G3P0_9EURO|nr:uncharacterized protein Z518_00306 [Rhinocladiella mackenziei CBS 650.93]KIX09227.1 hypothetical protein Z518_00306 [Rhinocladiella mackenziei CBS 650.93]
MHEKIAPATPAVRYKNIVATAGLRYDRSPYQGWPSNESDQLWSDLYNFGLTRISMKEVVLLANRTVPIYGDPGHYIVTLDVFHQLHCLSMIRQRIWSTEETTPFGYVGDRHMDHCIESIRESLMCSSDISPRPYGWSEEFGEVLPVNQFLRTCRDFDALRDWAMERQVRNWNTKVHVDDPLGNIYVSPSE